MGDSTFVQIVEQVALALAAQSGQTAVRQPGSGGWTLQGLMPATPDVRVRYRRQDLSANDSPPRVVIVAVGGDIVPPDQVGGVNRNWRTRVFGMQVFCWGQDDGQTEDLFTNTMLAFQHLTSDGGQPGKPPKFSKENWDSEQDEAGQATRGWMISFSVSLEITVKDRPLELLTVVREIDNALALTHPTEVTNVIVR